jgi:hypothetical protein
VRPVAIKFLPPTLSTDQLAAMSRADTPEEERRDFYLYVDEFQNFATDSFASILSEARKYRLNLTIANQYLAQMDEATLAAVFGNIGTLISFQVGAQDAEAIAEQLGGEATPQDLMALPRSGLRPIAHRRHAESSVLHAHAPAAAYHPRSPPAGDHPPLLAKPLRTACRPGRAGNRERLQRLSSLTSLGRRECRAIASLSPERAALCPLTLHPEPARCSSGPTRRRRFQEVLEDRGRKSARLARESETRKMSSYLFPAR